MKPNFQLILVIVFIVAAIAGVLVFSGAIPIGESEEGSQGTVVLWGTVPAQLLTGALEEFNEANTAFIVRYEQKSADSFDRDLLEALATGQGPDLFFLPDDLAYHYANKIFTIPYASLPLANFKNTFAGAGEVFLTSAGAMAFPMTIDPVIMYYNRSMLNGNGIVFPPEFWEDLVAQVPLLTKKDDSGRITESAVALGQSENVRHAKEILATLFMQAGNPLVVETGEGYRSMLDASVGSYNLPSILRFYTDFADPSHSAYSWNRSFANSDDAFSSGDLAYYFGFASELDSFVARNPNQDFFVAGIPQIKNSNSKITGARVTGLAVSSQSRNFDAAFSAASLLATSDFAHKFAEAQQLAPARRDLLNLTPGGSYSPIFYRSALFAKSWLDPSPPDTDNIWAGMINAVLSNSMTEDEAIRDASSKLELLLN